MSCCSQLILGLADYPYSNSIMKTYLSQNNKCRIMHTTNILWKFFLNFKKEMYKTQFPKATYTMDCKLRALTILVYIHYIWVGQQTTKLHTWNITHCSQSCSYFQSAPRRCPSPHVLATLGTTTIGGLWGKFHKISLIHIVGRLDSESLI